ncbi:hypothetical protein BGZ76_003117, partial [Entomortierella beljakovae]
NDIKDDYESIVVPFIAKYPEIFTDSIKEKFFSLEAFKSMTEQVSSRSMDVDQFHITAMVPFADFVNHSSNPNADFLTHEEVCDVCGALICEHMEESDDEEDDNDEDSDSDESVLEDGDEAPQLVEEKDQTTKKSKSSKKTEEEDNEEEGGDEEDEWEDEDEDMEEDDDDEDDDGPVNDTCDIILDIDIKKGEEITRHYGPYTNKVYLSKYGFAIQDNEFDTLTVQLDMIQQAASKFIKDGALVEERIAWFLENEDLFIGADDEHEHEHEHGGGCCGSESEESCESDDAEDKEMGKSNSKVHKASDEEEAAEQSDEEMDEDEGEDDDEEEEEEEDFPRDIMFMSSGGRIDDRSLLLLNVLFMEKSQFAEAKEDLETAMEYFSEVFIRRQKEEPSPDNDDEEDDDEDDEKAPELKPRDAKSKKVQKAVLQAILELIRIRAEAFGVTFKSNAQKDLAKLSEPLYYGGLCVYGEKSILEDGIQHYTRLFKEL